MNERNDFMDIISAKLGANMAISELTANGQIGSSTNPVYTFNGNSTGKQQIGKLVKMSDSTPDLNDIVNIRGFMGGTEMTLPMEAVTVVQDEGVQLIRIPYGDGSITAAACFANTGEDVERGFYILNDTETGMYISYVEFAETVKTIDSKYLPAVAELPESWIADLKTALGIG